MSREEIEELVGLRFGDLTVTAFLHRDAQRVCIYQIKCDCGRIKSARRGNLLNGSTVSCGCKRAARARTWDRTTHGQWGSPEYNTWASMKKRCQNPEHEAYPHYGGRGIKVCERWSFSFEDFYADMGPRPSAAHSLERVDNEGCYEPTNCRWATASEQGNNKRTNHLLTVSGKTATVAQWAAATGQPAPRLYKRAEAGWTDYETVYGRAGT